MGKNLHGKFTVINKKRRGHIHVHICNFFVKLFIILIRAFWNVVIQSISFPCTGGIKGTILSQSTGHGIGVLQVHVRSTQWLKIIPHLIRSYYLSCSVNKPVFFSHCVHLKLGHRFHALLKVCFDHDDSVPLNRHLNNSELLTPPAGIYKLLGFFSPHRFTSCSRPVYPSNSITTACLNLKLEGWLRIRTTQNCRAVWTRWMSFLS